MIEGKDKVEGGITTRVAAGIKEEEHTDRKSMVVITSQGTMNRDGINTMVEVVPQIDFRKFVVTILTREESEAPATTKVEVVEIPEFFAAAESSVCIELNTLLTAFCLD